MPQLTSIPGSGWLTTGTCTAANTGFAAISGFTFLPANGDVPPGSTAVAILTAGKNVTASLTAEPSNTGFQGSEKHFWSRGWARLLFDPTATMYTDGYYSNGASTPAVYMYQISASGTKFGVAPRSNNKAVGNKGLRLYPAGGTNTELVSNIGHVRAIPEGGTGGWQEFTMHIDKTTPASSVCELYSNGVCIARTVTDLSTYTGTNIPIVFPPFPGMTWQVSGTWDSWSGTDIDIEPRWELNSDSEYTTMVMPVRHVTSQKCAMYTYGGTMSVVQNPYATNGAHDDRDRDQWSGSASQTGTRVTNYKIGTLPYNTLGWAVVRFQSLYFPGGGTASLKLYNDAGDTVLVQIDYDGTAFKQGSTVLATVTNADRYEVMISLNRSGEATVSIKDQSVLGGRNWWSAPLEDWVPQDLGVVEIDLVRGSADMETDGIDVHSKLLTVVHSSFVHSLTYGPGAGNYLEPHLGCRSSHQTYGMAMGGGASAIPNGPMPNSVYGYPYAHVCIAGQSGYGISDLWTNTIQYMTYSRGHEVFFINGCGINNFTGINSEATSNSEYTSRIGYVDQIFAKLIATQNYIWWVDQADPILSGGNYDQWVSRCVHRTNEYAADQCGLLQTNRRIKYSPIAKYIGNQGAILFNASYDVTGTHMYANDLTDATGDSRYAKEMYSHVEVAEKRFTSVKAGGIGAMRMGI